MGTVTDTYAYDAWGNLMAHAGTTAQPYQFAGQLGYYTHWQDENLAVLQLGVRFYDPQVGRFGQVERAREVLNRYNYTGDSPLSYVDYSGTKRENYTDDFDNEAKYRQCITKALSKFRRCIIETYGITDIGGASIGCLAGCVAIGIWNGELALLPCTFACSIGATCYGGYTLVRAYFKCVKPFERDMLKCERMRRGK